MYNSVTTQLTTSKSCGTKAKKGENIAKYGRTHKTPRRAFAKVHFSKDSKRTPCQVMKVDNERKDGILQMEKAYEWAVSAQVADHENRAKLAHVASNLFIMLGSVLRLIAEKSNMEGKNSYYFLPSRQVPIATN